MDDFQFVASLPCVTGAALSSILVEVRGRRSTLAPGCRFRSRHVTLTQRDRSRCGAMHMLRMRSEPSAHFGVGQIALAVARCAFCKREANPLHTLGGSNRSRCGAVRILSMRSDPSAYLGWVKSLSLRRGAHFEHAKFADRSVSEVSITSVH